MVENQWLLLLKWQNSLFVWPHRWEIRLWRSTVNPRRALHTHGPSSSSKPGAIKCCCFWGPDWAWCLIIVSLFNTWPLTDNHTKNTGVTAKEKMQNADIAERCSPYQTTSLSLFRCAEALIWIPSASWTEKNQFPEAYMFPSEKQINFWRWVCFCCCFKRHWKCIVTVTFSQQSIF